MILKEPHKINDMFPFFRKALVCNYGPGGNNSGEDVYKKGTPGSECPKRSTKTFQGLCKHENKTHQ